MRIGAQMSKERHAFQMEEMPVYLGHRITSQRLNTDDAKEEAITKNPKDFKE